MKKISLLLVTALTLVSCKSFNGVLEVNEELKLNTKNGVTVFSIGQRNAEVEIKSKRTAYLKVDGKKVKFRLPKGAEIPTNGEFFFEGKKIGQDYDLEGESQVNVALGPIVNGWEGCQVSVPRTICNGTTCWTEWVNMYGQRQVQYQNRTTTQEIEMDFMRENVVAAAFEGNSVSHDRVYRYAGACYY